jgi:Zn-finger nucleic acid-binding protein
MKCPNCVAELAKAKRDGVELEACPACKGMWLTRQELDQLENEVFDLGDRWKGSLVFHEAASERSCPECSQPLGRFQYRDYDLQMEFCPDGHGFWLEEGEDRRVLDLMRKEEAALKRKYAAEEGWAAQMKHWRSPAFIDKIRDLFR